MKYVKKSVRRKAVRTMENNEINNEEECAEEGCGDNGGIMERLVFLFSLRLYQSYYLFFVSLKGFITLRELAFVINRLCF